MNIAEILQNDVLIFDGPTGTEFYRHHVFVNRCYEELNLSDPELVRKIHRNYAEAGAEVLTTNTFGANRVALGRFALAERVREVNRLGAELARQVADKADHRVLVAGSIGPLPRQPQYRHQLESMIIEQAESLLEGGADLILFETQPGRQALEICARAMKRLPAVPFIVSVAIGEGGETASGEAVEQVLAPVPSELAQPVALGMNCGSGPSGLLAALERAVKVTNLPLVVQPNAGVPKEVDNRTIYFCSPEYLTSYAKRYVALGARGVGGCCGIEPEHIRQVAEAVKPLARAVKPKSSVVHAVPAVEEKEPVPLAERSHLGRRLAAGQWITSVELLPPRGYDLRPIIEKTRRLAAEGVTAVNIPDGPRASSRISPLVTAEHIQRHAGIEVILHFCCRDRNLIGMQADLLGCAACGVRNILFVTGDPPKLGNYPHATGVFDTDSIGMVAVQRRLNAGIDLGGQPIDPPTAAVIGVGLDPTALDRRRELNRFREKIAAGAEFAITQPVFDPEALLRFLDELGDCPIPIIAGIWPLASYRNALFLKNEVPGVEIPEAVLQRMEAEPTRQGQLAVGVEIARESVARLRSRIAGIQVSAPLGKIDVALEVIQGW